MEYFVGLGVHTKAGDFSDCVTTCPKFQNRRLAVYLLRGQEMLSGVLSRPATPLNLTLAVRIVEEKSGLCGVVGNVVVPTPPKCHGHKYPYQE